MESQSSSTASADPSSLRAAALLTLKAKRRKPANEQPSSFSRPLPASDAFQLDYGQGDTPDHSMDTSKPSNITANSPPVSLAQPAHTENGDLQMREEGEISDEEGASPPSPAPNPPPTQGKSSPSPVYPKNVDVSFLTSPRRTPAAELPRLPLAHRTPNFSPVSRVSYDNQPALSEPLLQGVNHVDNSSFLVSADQVRPGLPLTQSEYDTAKDIVLDILGWGVPPEYLVDCGLTREIIYYVFTELNLRLPQNLDITGLIPYTPDAVLAFRRSTLMPPPPLPEGIRRSVSGSSLASSSTLTDPRQKRLTPPLAVLSPTSSNGSPIAGDLHDMERLRRQELMARKAVQASRKLKQQASTDTTSVITTGAPPINQDVEMMSAVPTETVDDFLNSIGHIPSTGSTPDPTAQVEGAEMDVDDIPGLGIAHQDGPRTPSCAVVSEFIPKSPMVLVATHAPSSSDLVATFDSRLAMADVGPSEDSTPDFHGFQRRGAKRPVAADFVDFDSVPRGNGSGNGHERANGYPLTRRRTGGANFTNLRPVKCVIDLSDSEGEDAGGDTHRGRTKHINHSLAASPGPTRPPSGNMSPAVLMEKELEILRMKQLIAQREQNRLKKLAISRSISNIDTNESLTPIKQEEDESAISSSVLLRMGEGSMNNVSERSSHFTTPRSILSEERTPSSNVQARESPSKSSDDDDTDGNDVQAPMSPRSIPAKQDSGLEAQDIEVVSQLSILESRQESQMDESVDVDPESSSSAQVRNPKSAHQKPDANLLPVNSEVVKERHEQFPIYDSPFDLCPLLRVRSPPMTSTYQAPLQFVSASQSSSLSDPSGYLTSTSSYTTPTYFPLPTLKPLKLATASKVLDPTKQVCQYEVPGGGTCRDEECEDLHLSRLISMGGVEPNDQDTAEFLCSVLPDLWLAKYNVSVAKVTVALQQANLKTPRPAFEERVAQALTTLGPPPPPPPR